MKLVFILSKLLILIVFFFSALRIWRSSRKSLAKLLWFRGYRTESVIVWIFILSFAGLLVYQAGLHIGRDTAEYRRAKRERDMHLWFEEATTIKGGIYDRRHKADKQLAQYSRDRRTGRIIRTYPLREAEGHLLGYSSLTRGRAGLEKAYLEKLMGQSNGSVGEIVNNFLNTWMRLIPRGNDLVLTIDYDLQKEAYDQLKQSGYQGAVVMLVPTTGEILAMASYPGFDPSRITDKEYWNKLLKDKDGQPFLNRAIKEYYPPGSTFKTIVAAAALEKGVTPQFVCRQEGLAFTGYRKRLIDHGNEFHNRIGLAEAMKKSCNQYFAQLGNAVGYQYLNEMATALRFNNSLEWNTDNDLFQKDFSIVKSVFPGTANIDSFRLGWASIGQDQDLATPMHMALIVAAIANGGKMPKPCLEADKWKSTYERAFSASAARRLSHLMQGVLEPGGTAYASRLNVAEMAGKTGTAEVAHRRPHAWFISFAPVDKPKIAMAVICENAGYGASVAAPISKRLYQKAKALGYF